MSDLIQQWYNVMDAEVVLGVKRATSIQALKSKIFGIPVYAAKPSTYT